MHAKSRVSGSQAKQKFRGMTALHKVCCACQLSAHPLRLLPTFPSFSVRRLCSAKQRPLSTQTFSNSLFHTISRLQNSTSLTDGVTCKLLSPQPGNLYVTVVVVLAVIKNLNWHIPSCIDNRETYAYNQFPGENRANIFFK